MKVSEVTIRDVIMLGRIDEMAPDLELIHTMFLPAAKSHIRQYTGLTEGEMDRYEDLSIAVCALCVHMYDNRSVSAEAEKENKVVREIVEKYSANLIPGGADG